MVKHPGYADGLCAQLFKNLNELPSCQQLGRKLVEDEVHLLMFCSTTYASATATSPPHSPM